MGNTVRLSSLYFDDGATCPDIFRQMFRAGCETRTTKTLGASHCVLDEATFDLIFSNYCMPWTNRTTSLREAATAQPDCYRVMPAGRGT